MVRAEDAVINPDIEKESPKVVTMLKTSEIEKKVGQSWELENSSILMFSSALDACGSNTDDLDWFVKGTGFNGQGAR